MDHRSVEWLHLVPGHSELIVGEAPASFAALFEPGLTATNGHAPAYIGWRSRSSDLPNLGLYESIALVNPRDVRATSLKRSGFCHTHTFTALPSLADTRWLLPLDNSRVSASSLRLADPWRFQDRMKKRILSGAARIGQLPRFGDVLLLANRSKSDLEKKLEESLGCSSVFLALKTGPPRTMRKTTVQVMREDGQILAYAKLATSSDARQVVQREVHCIQDLARHSALVDSIPRLLGTIETDGYYASILAAGPSARGPASFSDAHQGFLRAMASSTGRRMRFHHSEMWRDMNAKFDRLSARLSAPWHSRLSTALATLDAELGDHELLLTIAHRDFGSWNTMLNADGRLYVFDWDGARQEMIPLYDLFSFHFLDHGALVGTGTQTVIPRRIFDVCRQWAPEVPDRLIPPYFLAFLAELALSRLIGALWRADLDTDPILGSIASLLDSQAEWLPAESLSLVS